MQAPRSIYRIGFEDENEIEHLGRIPFGSLEEQVYFEEEDRLRIFDDTSHDDELLQSYIDFWLDLRQLRSISYHFCKDASAEEVKSFERYVKSREFVDTASERWGELRIVGPGPFDDPGAEITIWTDGIDSGCGASLARKFTPDESITYREVFEDYRWISSEFLKAQN